MGGASAFSTENFEMVCSLPLSKSWKSSFFNVPMACPCAVPHHHGHKHQVHRSTEAERRIALSNLGGGLRLLAAGLQADTLQPRRPGQPAAAMEHADNS